jgi:uncharacterized protein YraI
VKRLLSVLMVLILAALACSLPGVGVTPTPTSGGIVQGVVYADLNGNGSFDGGEGPLEGATVSLSGCGPALSQSTGADGAFQFNDLPAGSCLVQVAKGGWIFSGSFPSLGYPIPVASNPNLPTSFSIMMAPVSDNIPTETPALPTDTPGPTLTPTPSVPMVSPLNQDVNCRFGPSVKFSADDALRVGNQVPITGRTSDSGWWQIDGPLNPGYKCWVAASVTQATGDLASVPVVPAPAAYVTDVTVKANPTYNACGGPNPTDYSGTITTNGPTTVKYRWEIGGDKSAKPDPETITFDQADTKSVGAPAFSADCGNYYIMLVIISPNSMSAKDNYTIP